jgi:DnaJ-class molecular chaperone
MNKKCSVCSGVGFGVPPCSRCNGIGDIPLYDRYGEVVGYIGCTLCNGDGSGEQEDCKSCNGKGFRDWVDEIRRPI